MDNSLSQLQRVAIAPAQLQPPHLRLTPDQTHYLRRVLRLQLGDRFIAMDGVGHWWLAVLGADRQADLLEPIGVAHELPIPMTLLVAMPKGSGMDDIVRQTTELGVAEIWPIMSDRSLLQPSTAKLERWRRIASEAAEQAERQWIPQVRDPQPWPHALEQMPHPDATTLAYLCVARGEVPPLLTHWMQRSPAVQRVFVATGPEGGWSEAEQAMAIAQQFQPVSLGQRILRAVTAPGCAIALLAAAQDAAGTAASNP